MVWNDVEYCLNYLQNITDKYYTNIRAYSPVEKRLRSSVQCMTVLLENSLICNLFSTD